MTIESYAIKIEEINQKINSLEKLKKVLSEKLMNEMDEKNISDFVIDDGDKKLLSIKNIKMSKIKYDIAKAKQILGNKVKQYCDKEYNVDKVELDIFLQKYPEIKRDLKKVISTKYNISESKIENAYSMGEINMDEIKCFSDIKTTNYIRCSRIKRQEEVNE